MQATEPASTSTHRPVSVRLHRCVHEGSCVGDGVHADAGADLGLQYQCARKLWGGGGGGARPLN